MIHRYVVKKHPLGYMNKVNLSSILFVHIITVFLILKNIVIIFLTVKKMNDIINLLYDNDYYL